METDPAGRGSVMSQLRPTVIYPNPPDYFDQDEARRLLLFCHQNNVQDINILSDKPVVGRVHGWLCPVTERPITPAEIEQFATLLYDKNAVSRLAGGKPIDTAYAPRPERNKRIRLRLEETREGKECGNTCIYGGTP